jgi:hypothetical protein
MRRADVVDATARLRVAAQRAGETERRGVLAGRE